MGEAEHARRRASAREATRPRRRAGERDAVRPALSLVVTRTETDEAPRRDPDTGRRTVTITGQRAAPAQPRRRPDAASRVGPRPDRIAMWAFLMGIFLVGVATATADAAPL